MSTSAAKPWTQLVDLMIYAPAGLLTEARRRYPELVNAGREQVEGQVRLARVVGEFAIQRARRRLDRQLAEWKAAADMTAPEIPASSPSVSRPAISQAGDPASSAGMVASVAGPDEGTPESAVPPGYDAMTAAQILALLAPLTDEQLAAVADYETSHRGRRTVLGRVTQLRAGR